MMEKREMFSFAPAGAGNVFLGNDPIAGAMGYFLAPLRGWGMARLAAEQRLKVAHGASYGIGWPKLMQAPDGAIE